VTRYRKFLASDLRQPVTVTGYREVVTSAVARGELALLQQPVTVTRCCRSGAPNLR
jgi:hypothetical protein